MTIVTLTGDLGELVLGRVSALAGNATTDHRDGRTGGPPIGPPIPPRGGGGGDQLPDRPAGPSPAQIILALAAGGLAASLLRALLAELAS